MFDRHDIEAVVRSGLGPASALTVSRSGDDDHYLTLTIRPGPSATPAAAGSARAEARIGTNGVDTFVLALDGVYEYRDIDWVPEGQRQILTLMTRLAQAYLAGGGREGERLGLFGRRYGQLTLELEGRSFLFRGTSSQRSRRR